MPEEGNEACVSHREDVFDVSHRPSDPRFPHMCMDEAQTQGLDEKREALPMTSGTPQREDSE
jgi:hypothetical protein